MTKVILICINTNNDHLLYTVIVKCIIHAEADAVCLGKEFLEVCFSIKMSFNSIGIDTSVICGPCGRRFQRKFFAFISCKRHSGLILG